MKLNQNLLCLENMYQNTLKDHFPDSERRIHSISNIDFWGLNVSESSPAPYESKIYYQAEEAITLEPTDHDLIRFAFIQNIIRCLCRIKGTRLSRGYIALKNRSAQNMNLLFQVLQDNSSYIQSDILQYPQLFSFLDCTATVKTPLLHMIGVKSFAGLANIFNLEWMLRDVSGNKQKYDDMYYFSYIKGISIPEFSKLIDFAQSHWERKIKSSLLHLWLMAIDYFPNGDKKFKLYFKGCYCQCLSKLQDALYDFCPKGISRIRTISQFLSNHKELTLYGFALCLSSTGERSINYYFISTDDE